ncbi:hypothetical protein LAD12857_20470 [Lacrimispora amygdalina]|uniref:Uncharacterized protein n=1 Tax=Lacrimispora amygdalina TaxID=253257 RepID=A0ABQ5M694_9FIRM|nr:hypothetical protein [uncultured Clostridium sp.]
MGLFGNKMISTSVFHIDGLDAAGFKHITKLSLDKDNSKLLLYVPGEKIPYEISITKISSAKIGNIVDKVRDLKGMTLEIIYQSQNGSDKIIRFLFSPMISTGFNKFVKELENSIQGPRTREL